MIRAPLKQSWPKLCNDNRVFEIWDRKYIVRAKRRQPTFFGFTKIYKSLYKFAYRDQPKIQISRRKKSEIAVSPLFLPFRWEKHIEYWTVTAVSGVIFYDKIRNETRFPLSFFVEELEILVNLRRLQFWGANGWDVLKSKYWLFSGKLDTNRELRSWLFQRCANHCDSSNISGRKVGLTQKVPFHKNHALYNARFFNRG